MLPADEVTFEETMEPFCINCGSDELLEANEPFYGGKLYLVVPLICSDCSYSLSLKIKIKPISMVKK